ncbi:hypothetical protein N7445_005212, partial [Penicillium cf. griseofulvum]
YFPLLFGLTVPIYSKPFRTAREYLKTAKRLEVYLQYFASKGLPDKVSFQIFHDPGYITRHFDTIYLKEEPLKYNYFVQSSRAQRTSPHTSLKTPIEPNDTTSGSIEPSRKRKRAKRKQPNTLTLRFPKLIIDQDTYFKRLRKTFNERDQEVEKLDQEVKNLEQEVKKQQKQVQELQSKLLQQEDQHQEELSRRYILDCKIYYKQPDC